jgi:hypothetical protein
MKIAFVIHNDAYLPRVMELLDRLGIDYYTRWEHVRGKGHGTDPHLGTRIHPGTNSVLMIAFDQEALLEELIERILELNKEIVRPDDHIRLFQVPLERIV